MTIREILARGATGACLLHLAGGLAGCDRPPAPAAPTTQARGDSNTNVTEPTASGPSTDRPSQSTSPVSTQPTIGSPATRSTAEGDLPPLPQVDLDALPERVRRKIVAAQERIQAAPASSTAICELGALYLGQDLHEPAIACFRRAVAVVPRSPAPRYYLGVALAQSGDEAAAEVEFAWVMEADGGYPPARIRHADLVYKRDRAKATELYRKTVEILPNAPYPHYRLGQCLMDLDRPDEAERELLKAVELQANYRAPLSALAEIYRARKNAELADKYARLADLGTALRGFSDPLYVALLEMADRPQVISRRALALANSGKVDDAIVLLKNAAAREPDEFQYISTLASIHETLGNFGEAAQLWEQIYVIDPKWPSAATRLASAHVNANHLPRAIATLRSHVRRTPDDGDARHALALCLVRNKECDDAVNEAQAALTARGATSFAICEFAAVLIDCGKLEEAATRLDEAESKQAEGPRVPVAFYRAMLHAAAGRNDQALVLYDIVMDQYPSMVDAYTSAVRVARAQGDYKRQRSILTQGVEANPEAHVLSAELAQLLASCDDDSIRDGKTAVKLAERACLATAMLHHRFVDILGQAHAEAGQFDKAAKFVRQAIELARRDRSTDAITEYQGRLRLYEAGKAYRMRDTGVGPGSP